MGTIGFDRLARIMSVTTARRGLLGCLAAIPLVGGLFALLHDDEVSAKGRRRRRKKPHKHGKGNGRHRKGKRKCVANSRAQVCAGKCGSVKNSCGKRIDCGSCACASQCPICQVCQEGPNTPGVCVPDPDMLGDTCSTCHTCDAAGECVSVTDGTACDDGNPCTTDETCIAGECGGGSPVACDNPPACRTATGATCNAATGACEYPNLPDGTRCGNRCEQACTAGTCGAAPSIVCNACQQCDPDTGTCAPDPAKQHTCDGPCPSGEWCDAGACADIQETVLIPDCQGLCNGSTNVCSQLVTCPSCANCDAQTGCRSDRIFTGAPAGPGEYCATTAFGGGQPCTTNANCPSGLYCGQDQPLCFNICPF
jgi:hypothetical protein